jgi:hypothetical protein
MANALAPTHTLGPHHSVAMKWTLATSQTSFYIWQTHYVGHMPLAAVTNASRHPSPTQAMLPAGTGCSCTLKTGTRATVSAWTCLRGSITTCCPGTAARPVWSSRYTLRTASGTCAHAALFRVCVRLHSTTHNNILKHARMFTCCQRHVGAVPLPHSGVVLLLPHAGLQG